MDKITAIITGVKADDEKNIDGYETERRVALAWFRQSGKTQSELSKFCGLGQGTISGIKDGTKGSRTTFAKIAKAFGKQYEDYFKAESPPPKPKEGDMDTNKYLIEKLLEKEKEIFELRLRIKELEDHPPQPRAQKGSR